ncbi:MAG: hypothetical protein RL616_878 [Verrucomicrobiota bacterium]
MKAKHLLTAFVSSFIIHTSAFGQGALTPPGAPAPTMKSLDQVEARTPISSAPFTISQPGSYYLTANVSVTTGHAIIISTNNVTLDLCGFTISSTASSANGYGVALTVPGGNLDVTICNGHIKGGTTNNGSGVFSGPGFSSGIDLPGGFTQNCRVKDVSVSGCLTYGIFLGTGDSSSVESCSVRSTGYGITADTVTHCDVRDIGSSGITATSASDCRAEVTGNASAIALSAFTANNCAGICNGSGQGINVANGVAIGCYASSSGAALLAKIANSCVIGNGTVSIVNKYNMP